MLVRGRPIVLDVLSIRKFTRNLSFPGEFTFDMCFDRAIWTRPTRRFPHSSTACVSVERRTLDGWGRKLWMGSRTREL